MMCLYCLSCNIGNGHSSTIASSAKSLPFLHNFASALLFGENQTWPVKQLCDAFTSAIQQHKETAALLDVFLNRVASCMGGNSEYFDLLGAAMMASGNLFVLLDRSFAVFVNVQYSHHSQCACHLIQ